MKRAIGCHLILLILLAAVSAWAGTIYKWVDENGVVYYTDQAPDTDNVTGSIETREAVTGNPPPAAGDEDDPAPPTVSSPPESRRQTADVDIYTTSWCRYCRDTKNYFRSRGVAFTEYDIEKDRAAARRLRRYNPRGGVPVTVINGRPIVGYAPAAFARALKES